MASPRFLRNVANVAQFIISKGKGKHFDPFRTLLLLRSYSFFEQFALRFQTWKIWDKYSKKIKEPLPGKFNN